MGAVAMQQVGPSLLRGRCEQGTGASWKGQENRRREEAEERTWTLKEEENEER